MKNALLSTSFLFICTIMFSQGYKMGSFKVSKVNFSMGSDRDMLRGMSYSYFADQIPLDKDFAFRDNEFDNEDIASMYCENHLIALGFTLKHDKFEHLEWRNTIISMEERGDGVTYTLPEGEVHFSSTQNEYGLESMVLYARDLPLGFKLYGGLGTNLGISVDNVICVDGGAYVEDGTRGTDGTLIREYKSIDACFDASNMFNQRILSEVGLAWAFRNAYEIGLNVRNGVGYRKGGGTFSGTDLESVNVSFAYYLN